MPPLHNEGEREREAGEPFAFISAQIPDRFLIAGSRDLTDYFVLININ